MNSAMKFIITIIMEENVLVICHYVSNHYKYAININDILIVITDIITDWYVMLNTIMIAINFCNAKKMNCALRFTKQSCLSNLLQLEQCIFIFNVIFDIMAH